MGLKYDKLFALMERNGITSYKLQKGNLLGNKIIENLKSGNGGLGHKTLERLCYVFKCQPSDLCEFVQEDGDDEKFIEYKQILK